MRNHTKQLLELNIEKKEGIRTSFHLEKKRYKKFQKLCKKRGITPSTLIDSMIQDLLEELGEDEPYAFYATGPPMLKLGT